MMKGIVIVAFFLFVLLCEHAGGSSNGWLGGSKRMGRRSPWLPSWSASSLFSFIGKQNEGDSSNDNKQEVLKDQKKRDTKRNAADARDSSASLQTILPTIEATQTFIESYTSSLGIQQTYIALKFNRVIVLAHVSQGSLSTLLTSKEKKQTEEDEESASPITKPEAHPDLKLQESANFSTKTNNVNSNICISSPLKTMYQTQKSKVYSVGFPIECHQWMQTIHNLEQEYFQQHHESIPSSLLALNLADIQQARSLSCPLTSRGMSATNGPKPRPFAVNCLIVDLPNISSDNNSITHQHAEMYSVDVSGNFYQCKAVALGYKSSVVNKWLQSRGRYLAQQRLQQREAKRQQHSTDNKTQATTRSIEEDTEDAMDILHNCIVEIYSNQLNQYSPESNVNDSSNSTTINNASNATTESSSTTTSDLNNLARSSSNISNSMTPIELKVSCFQYDSHNSNLVDSDHLPSIIEEVKVDLEALLAPEDVKETEIEVEVAKDFVEVGSQSVSSSDKETENTAKEKENVSSGDNSPRVKVSKHYRVGRLWQLVRRKLSMKSSYKK